MVVVAVAAMAAAGEETRRRGQSYRLRAEYHLAARRQLDGERKTFWCGYGLSDKQIEAIQFRRDAERRVIQEAVEYHDRLYSKYQLAARRPWLPVDLDPPPPWRANPILVTADDY
jgi:hypothetical protein